MIVMKKYKSKDNDKNNYKDNNNDNNQNIKNILPCEQGERQL